jgi:hypothetical protein
LQDYVIIVLGLIFGVSGSILGRYWFTNRTGGGVVQELKQQLKLKDETLNIQTEQILNLKKAYSTWKGKATRNNIPPQIQGDPTDPEKFIPALIDNYATTAPGWIQTILKTPGIKEYAVKLAKEHPDDAKRFLEGFLKPTSESQPGQTKGQISPDQQTEWA